MTAQGPTTIRILLAEDNRRHQHLLLKALASCRPHVNVTIVDSGAEFLTALKLQRFDCVILDYDLPDYSADHLLQAGRDDLRNCPALVVFSSFDHQTVVSSVRGGGLDFIARERAVIGDELWTRVEHAVNEQRRRRRERRLSERRRRYLIRQTEADSVTGLKNRHYFDRCRKEGRWQKGSRGALSCAMLEIDPHLNAEELCGPEIRDAALQSVGRTVREHAGSADTALRWGGQKILIIRPSSALLDTWLWAETLRQKVESLTAKAGGTRLHVTASFGLVECRGESFGDRTIHRANEALALARELGSNRICTGDMVEMAQHLGAVNGLKNADIRDRRTTLLRRMTEHLGPTQTEHITDHCDRVSRMAVRIARQMGLDTDTIEHISLAALLHDIGKCVIPEELLAKPRTLAIAEWRLMALHDVYGAWITEKLGLDEVATSYLRNHHQRHDTHRCADANGEGPETDQPIPIGARVLCVADALVTMLTVRTYRAARSDQEALNELRRESGRQFDPAVVEAARKLSTYLPIAA